MWGTQKQKQKLESKQSKIRSERLTDFGESDPAFFLGIGDWIGGGVVLGSHGLGLGFWSGREMLEREIPNACVLLGGPLHIHDEVNSNHFCILISFSIFI